MRGLLPAALLAPALALAQPAPAPAPESRVALVIGNAAYPSSRLRNPVNDATAVAERLRALGFEVTLKTDVKQREMTRAVSVFGQSIKPRGVALFYYAGHGLQVRGRNFLVPIDAEIESEASARSEAVDLDLVLEQLGPARLSMVILDACRNNPFENKFRSVGGGLAQVDAPKGTLLAYATAPGKVASDGEGAHGLYTEEILKAIDVPGIKVEEVFKRVRVNVIKATGGEQIPWEASSLTGDYYFRPATNTGAPDKALRDARMKQEELQKRLDAERTQRERDAQALKAEMEQLRSEVRKLTQANVPASAEPAKPARPVPVPAPDPDKSTQKAAPPEKLASAAPAPAKGNAAPAANAWARRIELLESRRGKLTFSSALAILLDPLTDQELTGILEREKYIKRMGYDSALAVGMAADGKLVWWRVAKQSNPIIAQQLAESRCRPSSAAPCVAIMVNGDFREAGFIEWARGAKVKDVKSIRSGFLRMPS